MATAVQDTFGGRTFRRVKGDVRIGEILATKINCDRAPERTMLADALVAISNYRIVEQVHPNTVRAVLRRAGAHTNAGHRRTTLAPGNWYRVIED